MNDKMPEVIYTDINGNATRSYIKGFTKYIRSDLYDRRVTELLEANNRLVEDNRKLKAGLQPWQLIETAPKDGTRILLSDPYSGIGDGYYCNLRWWFYECGDDWYSEECNPTHWMPLPEPPK